ncbi:MAG: MXAN_5187 family protein [Acidobacteriota bacterium]
MFLSKIWIFLLALAASVALTVALVMPRPAQRAIVADEHDKLRTACSVIGVLLADDARKRVELAGTFARAQPIVGALESASGANTLDASRMKSARSEAEKLIDAAEGGRKPDFAILIDRRGRVVARARLDQEDFGDVLAGRPLVDDALAGYLRDDLWPQNNTMYLVSASPVVKREATQGQNPYVGAVVLGYKFTNELAQKLAAPLEVDLAFHLGSDEVASSKSVALDHKPMQDAAMKLAGNDLRLDCASWDAAKKHPPLDIHAGNDVYHVVVARLPGEAQARGAFYSVFVHPPDSRGFMGTLKAIDKDDLSFRNFPWIFVGAGFIVVLALGIGLTWVEADRPLRRLAADAVKLAKNETERLREDAHGGKFGSIARSVNIHIDKLGRDAKSARTNLDSLLGPAPDAGGKPGGLGTIDLLAGALPTSRPGGPAPAAPPPPSEFRFGEAALAQTMPAPAMRPTPQPAPAVRATPPPVRNTPPRGATTAHVSPPPPAAINPQPSAPLRLDDDILAGVEPEPEHADPYFKQVFDQFLAVKQSCNEPTGNLTYEKFAEKLVKNRDDLMAKTGCREVRFTVYVKDGKAALKATPVKDEA